MLERCDKKVGAENEKVLGCFSEVYETSSDCENRDLYFSAPLVLYSSYCRPVRIRFHGMDLH